jgi:hypothetical protein
MYVKVPENRLSATVVKSISADGKAIPPLVIVPGRNIIMSWFSEQRTEAEIISVSLSGYRMKEPACNSLTILSNIKNVSHKSLGRSFCWTVIHATKNMISFSRPR